MKSTSKIFAASAFAAAVSFSATANANIFIIDYEDAGVWSAYDTDTQAYSMKFASDQNKDGFWLVVTDGDNPKGDGSSHAILYGDIENNQITAYTYNGANSADSYEAGTLLGTYENAFTTSDGFTMFSLDVSDINTSEFDGVAIGEKAGIWFHQSAGSDFSYGADGSISDYTFSNQMWLDRGNDDTFFRDRAGLEAHCAVRDSYFCGDGTQLVSTTGSSSSSSGGGSVPAPGGLALILVGLACLGRKFRNAKA